PERLRRCDGPHLATAQSANLGRPVHHRQPGFLARRTPDSRFRAMRVLWVTTNFMHPTTKGGQIRTLEMLRHLQRWNEIHFAAIENPAEPEGPARSREYCFRAYPMQHRIPSKNSIGFVTQL